MKTTAMQHELIRLGAGAHALAIQILGNRDDAADAVQDAMIKALTVPDAYDAKQGPLKPWFYRVVRNRCLDLLRGRRGGAETVDALPAGGPDPEAALATEQRDSEIRRALETLAPAHRQILVLRDYLDLGYADIGVVLDVPTGTVMSRLHRARNAMREALKNHVE